MSARETIGGFYLPEETSSALRQYRAVVKPVGPICNVDCMYCHYLDKKELSGSPTKFQVPDEILAMHMRRYIEGRDGPEVVLSWQGAEPTRPGMAFFEKMVALQKSASSESYIRLLETPKEQK